MHASGAFHLLLAGTLVLSVQLPLASAKVYTGPVHYPEVGPSYLPSGWSHDNLFQDTAIEDICKLPFAIGPCLALFTRWYYNSWSRKCLTFTYGGCGRNANNFRTRRDCEHRCARPSTIKPGTCPILLQGNNTLCGRFCSTDSSCPGNERCCEMSCGQQCQLPLEAVHGYCPRATVSHIQTQHCLTSCITDWDCGWGIRIPRKKCCRYGCRQVCVEAEEEHPGVCPKRRVVQTFVPCNDTCADDRDCPLAQKCCFTGCSRGCLEPVRSDRCQLPPEKGLCRARLRRFFYSPSRKMCLQFFYGGCAGNSNNFKTRKECEDACGEISPEVCKQPKESGQCLAFSEFFYYNSTTATCETFAYCGHKGNDNRFSTELECMMACGMSANATTDTVTR